MQKERADRQFAAWRAKRVIEQLALTEPPVLPLEIAAGQGIFVQASQLATGFSGCLMKQGDTFGILYSDRYGIEGFVNFTVAHELGHFFMEPHREHFFRDGNGIHKSRSGFVSLDPFEVEADHFAAALLMPESMFARAIETAGCGFPAIERLHDLFRTSLTATAIRYAELTPDPVVVVVSEADRISYAFASPCIRELEGVRVRGLKGSPVPAGSATATFNLDPENVREARTSEGSSRLDDWIDDAPAVEVQEDVVGLGDYGKTLTVLFADELPDPDEDLEEDE